MKLLNISAGKHDIRKEDISISCVITGDENQATVTLYNVDLRNFNLKMIERAKKNHNITTTDHIIIPSDLEQLLPDF